MHASSSLFLFLLLFDVPGLYIRYRAESRKSMNLEYPIQERHGLTNEWLIYLI